MTTHHEITKAIEAVRIPLNRAREVALRQKEILDRPYGGDSVGSTLNEAKES